MAGLDIRRPALRVDAHRESIVVELVPHRAFGASADPVRRPTAAPAEMLATRENGAKVARIDDNSETAI